MTFELNTYLERIGLAACPPTRAGLDELLGAQMRAIPFENIEPLLGIEPDLSPGAIWRKLVLSGRGGYCFELNELLGEALAAIGFQARRILGRVRMGASAGGPRSHLAWIVRVDGQEVLADAGFGGPGAVGAIAVEAGDQADSLGQVFRLVTDDESSERVLEKKTADGWFALYSYDDAPVAAADVDAANFLCARWEKSPFPSHLMLNLARRDGRASLFDLTVREETSGTAAESPVGSAAELKEILARLFRLDCGQPTVDAVWQRLSGDAARRAA